jgi:hypothetical protein
MERTASVPAVRYPPFPPVIPNRVPTGDFQDVRELARGISLEVNSNFTQGPPASVCRKQLNNYRATFTINVTVPEAATQVAQLDNPYLDRMLPGLKLMFEGAKVSPFYQQLYARKETEIRKKLTSLGKILDRHNFYDTDTILELKHPQTGRKVLWLQSEMDVVSDGSDGDRLPTMSDKIVNSANYQPSTSYRWKKATTKPNPLLANWEKRLKNMRALQAKATGAKRTEYTNEISHIQNVIAELKSSSFLIGEYDPFIVVPLGIVNQSSEFSPKMGDFVIVIVEDRLFPAIVGDAGPRYKTGEGSLRLAKEINPKATSYARPVSDLKVSYVIFPGSASAVKGPPDYALWEQTCYQLLDEIGGLSPEFQLHHWDDLLAPKPEPTPSAADPQAPEITSPDSSPDKPSSADDKLASPTAPAPSEKSEKSDKSDKPDKPAAAPSKPESSKATASSKPKPTAKPAHKPAAKPATKKKK